MRQLPVCWLGGLLGVIMVTSGWLGAAAPPSRPNPTEVEKYLTQLGDRDFWLRHRAQEELKKMGPAVLPFLPPHFSSREGETRRRLLQLSQQLLQERDLAPRRVTARFDHAPLDQVLATVFWQTDLQTKWLGEECKHQPHFTGSFQEATYWEVIEQIARQTKSVPTYSHEALDPQGEQTQPVIGLRPTRRPARFVCSQGRFRLQLIHVASHGELPLLDEEKYDSPSGGLYLTLELFREPRLQLADLGMPQVQAAWDERGRSLVPLPRHREANTEEGAGPPGGVGRVPPAGFRGLPGKGTDEDEVVTQVEVVLARPYGDARRLARVRGTLPARVVASFQTTLLLGEIRRGAAFEVQGQKQEIRNLWNKAGGKMLQLQIVAKDRRVGEEDDEQTLDIFRLQQLLQFRDDEGRLCPSTITPSLFAGPILEVQPSSAGKRATHIFIQEPILRSVEIPFEFRDVPLP